MINPTSSFKDEAPLKEEAGTDLSKIEFVEKFQHHYKAFVFHRNQLNGTIGTVGDYLTEKEVEIFRIAVRNMKDQFEFIEDFLAEHDTIEKKERPQNRPT